MSLIEIITKQSPWLFNEHAIEDDVHLQRLKQHTFIYRDDTFLTMKFVDGVYIVTGPRQIGKTTLLKMLIKDRISTKTKENFLYFNCDLLDTKQDVVKLVETYLNEFSPKGRKYILLDEISSVKDSVLAIKYLVDSGIQNQITYILTGSSSVNIKKTGEHLPGRRGKGIDYHYTPLSFKDYIQLIYPDVSINVRIDSKEKDFIALKNTINLSKALENYLHTGGFPRVINEYHQNKIIDDDIFTIYRSWITSEIAKADRKEHIAKIILDRCLFSLSSDISYNAFAQDTGVGSHNTIYDYLTFFENAFVLSIIYNYDINQKKVNYRKNKKIYLNDPFIYAVIEGWLHGKPRQDYSYLQEATSRSNLIENIVYNWLSFSTKNVYFYKSNYEIDFIITDYLIEVKYQNKVSASDYSQLAAAKGKKLVLTKSQYKHDGDILLMPIEYFLLCDL